MKKLNLLLIAIIALSTPAFAQDKLLTLDDIFSPGCGKACAFRRFAGCACLGSGR